MAQGEKKDSVSAENTGYERRDAAMKGLITVAVVALVIVVVAVFAVYQLFIATREQIVDEVVLRPESVALRELRAREEAILNSYDVVDAQKGVYRIPIERAMTLTAERSYVEKSANP
jgi:hypothetical protein